MDERLHQIVQRYDNLSRELSDPATMADQRRYQTVAKEHASYRAIVEAYQEYQRVKNALADNQTLMQSEQEPELLRMITEERTTLDARLAHLTEHLRTLLLPKDPHDDKNVIVEIRAGTGGEEAALFAADLFRMYSRFAERQRWRVEVMDSSYTGLSGIKEIIALINGTGAYRMFKFESGVHRVQRVPKTEASGRIHTSAVTVAVLPEAEEIEVAVHEADLRVDVFRASGPGGQGVNTTDSAVRITHLPTGIVVTCRDERSQIKNRAKAMKVLRARILEQQQAVQDAAIRAERKSQVGSGDRSEKIRTYNFPQNRVTDHRIGKTLHQLDAFLDGDLEDMITALHTEAQQAALREGLSTAVPEKSAP